MEDQPEENCKKFKVTPVYDGYVSSDVTVTPKLEIKARKPNNISTSKVSNKKITAALQLGAPCSSGARASGPFG